MRYEYQELGQSAIQIIDGDRGINYPNGSDFFPVGHCLFLNAKNVTADGFSFSERMFISKEKDNLLRKGKLIRRDTVLTTRGTVGNIAYFSDDVPYPNMRINSGMVILRPNPDVFDSEFVYWLFRSSIVQNQILQLRSGTAQPQLPISSLQRLSIPIPTLDIQRKISTIIGSLQRKIELNQKVNDNLQQQALTLYSSMFLENPELPTIFGTLKDIAEITMGQSPSGSSYNDIGNGEVFYQGRAEFGYRFPTRRLYTTEPKRMAKAGDVLLSVRAPVGDLNVAYERCCIGRGLGAIHSRSGHQSFMLYTMFALRPQLDVFNGEGTVFGSINRNALNDIPIHIPPDETVASFEAVVRPMDDLIRTNYEENCRLQKIRDSLLPRLMSGEIDVSSV